MSQPAWPFGDGTYSLRRLWFRASVSTPVVQGLSPETFGALAQMVGLIDVVDRSRWRRAKGWSEPAWQDFLTQLRQHKA